MVVGRHPGRTWEPRASLSGVGHGDKSERTRNGNLGMRFFETQADRPDNRGEAYDFERGK